MTNGCCVLCTNENLENKIEETITIVRRMMNEQPEKKQEKLRTHAEKKSDI